MIRRHCGTLYRSVRPGTPRSKYKNWVAYHNLNRSLWRLQFDLQEASLCTGCSTTPYSHESLPSIFANRVSAYLWSSPSGAVFGHTGPVRLTRDADNRHGIAHSTAIVISKSTDPYRCQSCATWRCIAIERFNRRDLENGGIP